MNLFKIALLCLFGTVSFASDKLDGEREPDTTTTYPIQNTSVSKELVDELDKPSAFIPGFSFYYVFIEEPIEELTDDLKTKINDFKQNHPYVNHALTFIEQNGYAIATDIFTQLTIYYMAENDRFLRLSGLTLSALGLRSIEATMKTEYGASSYETRLYRTKPSPFNVRANFIMLGLLTMIYNKDMPSFTSFWLTFGLSLSTHNSNRMLSEFSGVISDMILLNSIHSLTLNYTDRNGYESQT